MWLIIDYQLFLPTNECSCSDFPWEFWIWKPAFLGLLWEDKNLQNIGANLRYPFRGFSVCTYVCVCMHVCEHACMPMCTMCACMCVYTWCVHVCIMHECAHVYMHVYVCVSSFNILIQGLWLNPEIDNLAVSSKGLSVFLSSSRMTHTHTTAPASLTRVDPEDWI